MSGMKKILSIDGGGIRGVIPALVLAALEDRCGKPIAAMFDLIAGTSTGGILALGLTIPDDDGGPKWSARKLVELYEKEGSTIFPRTFRQKVKGLVWSVFEEKYSAKGINKTLRRYFGDTLFKDALTELLITSYDIERRTPHFFKRWREAENTVDEFTMVDVARATSAAPTYFEPYMLKTNDSTKKYYALVDGGVFANNPAVCAYAEAMRRFDPDDQILIVSLGTGESTRSIMYDDACKWGLAGWARPMLGVMFDGVSDAGDYQLRWILNTQRERVRLQREEAAALAATDKTAPDIPHTSAADTPQWYYRFQCRLDSAMEDMDNAESENMRKLRLEAENLISACDRELTKVCGLLK